jgi:hypothetical protein
MENNLVCKSRGAAIAAIDMMAGDAHNGTQRAALLAVKKWIENNTTNGLTDEVRKKLEEIFYERTEEQKKGCAWLDREMEDPAYKGSTEGYLHHHHHKRIYEPEDGAELECFWNAKYKAWEPIGYGWPSVMETAIKSTEE